MKEINEEIALELVDNNAEDSEFEIIGDNAVLITVENDSDYYHFYDTPDEIVPMEDDEYYPVVNDNFDVPEIISTSGVFKDIWTLKALEYSVPELLEHFEDCLHPDDLAKLVSLHGINLNSKINVKLPDFLSEAFDAQELEYTALNEAAVEEAQDLLYLSGRTNAPYHVLLKKHERDGGYSTSDSLQEATHVCDIQEVWGEEAVETMLKKEDAHLFEVGEIVERIPNYKMNQYWYSGLTIN